MIAFSCHQYILAIAILVLSLSANYMLCTFGENKYSLASVSFSVFGLLYVGIGLISLLMIRHDSIYMSFAGRAFGKRKIVPSISPNKTLEGFIGGFIGCIMTGAVFSYIVGIPWWMGIHVGMISGILAPLGDLFESKIKRLCNVKDSGTLLPGHGGVLDRFDSLLFAAPITLIYILLFSY